MSETAPTQNPQEDEMVNLDPIWTSSRTARQIYVLGEVEKNISRLLSLAASTMSLMTLPQTDAPDAGLPKGDERSEQFVDEVNEYFQTLDSIQVDIRSTIAHIRQSRIAPSTINAPPPGFVPPALGVGLPRPLFANQATDTEDTEKYGHVKLRGLQEERVERDAWRGIFDALTRLRDTRDASEKDGAMVST